MLGRVASLSPVRESGLEIDVDNLAAGVLRASVAEPSPIMPSPEPKGKLSKLSKEAKFLHSPRDISSPR